MLCSSGIRLRKIALDFKEGFRCGGTGGTLFERRRRRSEFGFRGEKNFRSKSSDFYGTVTFLLTFWVAAKKLVELPGGQFETRPRGRKNHPVLSR